MLYFNLSVFSSCESRNPAVLKDRAREAPLYSLFESSFWLPPQEHDPQSFPHTSPVPVLPITTIAVLNPIMIHLECECELQSNIAFSFCSPMADQQSFHRWKHLKSSKRLHIGAMLEPIRVLRGSLLSPQWLQVTLRRIFFCLIHLQAILLHFCGIGQKAWLTRSILVQFFNRVFWKQRVSGTKKWHSVASKNFLDSQITVPLHFFVIVIWQFMTR